MIYDRVRSHDEQYTAGSTVGRATFRATFTNGLANLSATDNRIAFLSFVSTLYEF